MLDTIKQFLTKKFLSGLVFGFGIGLGIALVSFGVYLVIAASPGTQNPTAAPPGNDVSWAPLYIDAANQRVGIANPTPTEKLDVTGKIHATDDVCSNVDGGKCLSSIRGYGLDCTTILNHYPTGTPEANIVANCPVNYLLTGCGGGCSGSTQDADLMFTTNGCRYEDDVCPGQTTVFARCCKVVEL